MYKFRFVLITHPSLLLGMFIPANKTSINTSLDIQALFQFRYVSAEQAH